MLRFLCDRRSCLLFMALHYIMAHAGESKGSDFPLRMPLVLSSADKSSLPAFSIRLQYDMGGKSYRRTVVQAIIERERGHSAVLLLRHDGTPSIFLRDDFVVLINSAEPVQLRWQPVRHWIWTGFQRSNGKFPANGFGLQIMSHAEKPPTSGGVEAPGEIFMDFRTLLESMSQAKDGVKQLSSRHWVWQQEAGALHVHWKDNSGPGEFALESLEFREKDGPGHIRYEKFLTDQPRFQGIARVTLDDFRAAGVEEATVPLNSDQAGLAWVRLSDPTYEARGLSAAGRRFAEVFPFLRKPLPVIKKPIPD